jgi:hypothetical protein
VWKRIAAVIVIGLLASSAYGQPLDEKDLLEIGRAKTDSTVPSSRYEHPTMTLEEQETASRNSSASQQVNQDLNTDFANYREPVTLVIWGTALLATPLLALKSAWVGIPFVSAVAGAVQRGFFSWPTTPLEWVNKLAIYIGIADFVWLIVR